MNKKTLERRYQKWKTRVVRALYRDGAGGTDRAVLVVGTARSGTTWAAEVVAAGLRARLIFEPFFARFVSEARCVADRPYRRPDDEDEELLAFCYSVFAGTIRHPWVDRDPLRIRPRARVVKSVRAHLLLPWLRRRFPEVPAFLLIRHPCAVVASWRRLGWIADADLRPILDQPGLVADDLLHQYRDVLARLDGTASPEERIAALWCIGNAVALRSLPPEELHCERWEDLVADPEGAYGRIFARLGCAMPAAALRAVDRRTAWGRRSGPLPGRDAWRRDLDPEVAERILDVVDRFGMSDLYGRD